MNMHKSYRYPLVALFTAAILMLAACQPAVTANNPTATLPPAQPTATTAVLATQTPIQPTQIPTQIPSGASGDIILDLSGVAQNFTVETVAAVPSTGGAAWEAAPQYRLLTLQGYPVASHLLKPQIFIYPVSDLASANAAMGQNATDLQALLQSQQAGEYLPFLPMFNAQQVIHAQVQYLDFKSGKGVRFLTQYDQAPLPINNFELIYTFQGLTSDGKYYIAAVLPVTHPELPAGSQVSEQQAKELSDFPSYLSGMVSLLNQQSAGSFSPDLAKLDALIQSIEIK